MVMVMMMLMLMVVLGLVGNNTGQHQHTYPHQVYSPKHGHVFTEQQQHRLADERHHKPGYGQALEDVKLQVLKPEYDGG